MKKWLMIIVLDKSCLCYFFLQNCYTAPWLLSPWLVSTRHFENLFSVTISKFLPYLVSTKKFVYKRVAKLAWRGGDICARESYENNQHKKHCQIPHDSVFEKCYPRPPFISSTLVIVHPGYCLLKLVPICGQ